MQTTLPWYGSMGILTLIAMSRKKPEHWTSFQRNPAGNAETKKYKPPEALKKDKKSSWRDNSCFPRDVLDQVISGKKTLKQIQNMSEKEKNEESKNPFMASEQIESEENIQTNVQSAL